VQDFREKQEEELTQLSKELRSWSYKPQAVKRIEIPKPDGGVRNLGIPCVRDRVVQASMKRLMEPILDPTFSDSSFAFRPSRNQQQAVSQAKEIVTSGKRYVVDIDLSKFFDRIHHDKLISQLRRFEFDKRLLRLVGMMLRSGILDDGVIITSEEGVTQGSPLSPLLSNLVLDQLDKELESRGLSFCRYADDCNIFAKTQKAADRIMKNVCKYIETKLKLVVNKDKSKVAVSDLVKFLGMTIVNKTVAISKQSMSHAMQKVKSLTKRGTHHSLEETILRINNWYMGWSSYYSMTQYPAQFRTIESHIRRRLRSRFISQFKRQRYLYNFLVKSGIKPKSAYKTVYSNKKRWALSHTWAVERVYSNKWFKEIAGLKIRSNAELPHWFSLDKWVYLS
jgi:group II intron reverse transcriptase/maturase